MLLYLIFFLLFLLGMFWIFRSVLVVILASHEASLQTSKDMVLHLLRELEEAQENLLRAMKTEREFRERLFQEIYAAAPPDKSEKAGDN